ncbi:MAG: STAS/SEC14 domain-containing protein, partial [Asticcacaulis sp.]|nr:STAS/SEC14 domain-containing protein [Asticcacaulis sp.]
MTSRRNGISVEIHPELHFVLFKLKGVVYGKELLEVTERTYATLNEPWLYNRLFDIRQFINVLQFEDFAALAEQWPKIAGRVQQTRVAIVTEDPVRIARTENFGRVLPNVTARTFATIDEAEAWLAEDVPVKVR